MGDSLIDDVVREVFDIDHVFPVEFLKEEKHEGFWSRLWNAVRNAFGFRRSAVAPRDHQPGAADEGGSRPGPSKDECLRGWEIKADSNDLTVDQDLRRASLKLPQRFRAFFLWLLAPYFHGRDAVVVVQILGRTVHLEHTASEEGCEASGCCCW